MIINFIGECTINLLLSLKYIFTGRINLKNVISQCASIGYDSVLIVVIIALASGAVFALQIAKQFTLTGADGYVGGAIALSMLREMGPIFAALAVGARAGTAMAAEIGNMQVTEQIDALRVLKVDPIAYLLAPRLIAGTVMLPLLTVIALTVGILGGAAVAQVTVGLHFSRFLNSVWLYCNVDDIRISLVKAAVFGLLLTLVCCTHGLMTKGGAKEVGGSTTKASIWTATLILLCDYLLSWIFY